MSTAVATRANTLRDLLQNKKLQEAIKDLLPKAMTVERVMRLAMMAANKMPALYECDDMSIAQAMADSAKAGLEADGVHAALVPRKGKCCFEPMYQGLVELVRRSGKVWGIEANVVHEGDGWEYRTGLETVLNHRPGPNKAEPIVCGYAVAHFVGGGTQHAVMWPDELEQAAKMSHSPARREWPDEMHKKTVIKRLCKLLPKSAELQHAIECDNRQFGAGSASVDFAPDEPAAPATQTDRLKSLLPSSPNGGGQPDGESPAPTDDDAPATNPEDIPDW